MMWAWGVDEKSGLEARFFLSIGAWMAHSIIRI